MKNEHAIALGSIKSEKKTKSSIKNGKLGGRPKNISIKRLREMAGKFPAEDVENVLVNFMLISRFVNFVEAKRNHTK